MPKPKHRYARSKFAYDTSFGLRERVLTRGSTILSRTSRPLWYLETLVLSARFLQHLKSPQFGTHPGVRFHHRYELWGKGILPYLQSQGNEIDVLEFGVASGLATKSWLSMFGKFREWHGFDTFEGLPDPWIRGGVEVMERGVFAPSRSEDPFPKIDSYITPIWHKGLINKTLPGFERPSENPLFVLVDVDLYEPTVDVLDWMALHGQTGDCIYFDEAFDPFNEGLAIREAQIKGLRFSVLGHTGSALAIVMEGRC